MNFLVLDTDSITGVCAESFLEWENANRIPFSEAYLSGKSSIINERFRERLQSLSPGVKVYVFSASSIKHHADILCGYSIGRIVEKTKHFPDAEIAKVFILSKDHLVTSLAREALSEGLSVIVLKDSIPNLDGLERIEFLTIQTERAKKPTSEPQHTPPQWFGRALSPRESLIGLVCETVPTTALFEKPNFIPFPVSSNSVSVGSRDGDINLGVWDYPRKGLEPRNVVFEYHCAPKSQWTIRSLIGNRSGKGKRILVGGKSINSRNDYVEICGGIEVVLGGFVFRFRENRREAFLRFEDPNTIRKQIEENLKACIKKIPWALVDKLDCYIIKTVKTDHAPKQTIKERLLPDISNANWGAYGYLINNLWDWFPVISSQFRTRLSFLDYFFQDLRDDRNQVAHEGSSIGVSEQGKARLIDFLFLVEKERNNSSVNHLKSASPSPLDELSAALDQAFGQSS